MIVQIRKKLGMQSGLLLHRTYCK